MEVRALLIILFLFAGKCFAQVPLGSTLPTVTNKVKGSLTVDSVVTFTKYRSSDSSQVLAVDANGKVYLLSVDDLNAHTAGYGLILNNKEFRVDTTALNSKYVLVRDTVNGIIVTQSVLAAALSAIPIVDTQNLRSDINALGDTVVVFRSVLDRHNDSITALRTAVNSKEPAIPTGSIGQYFAYNKTWQTLNKSAVGLSNVDNTSDIDKPISSATSNALALKMPWADTGSSGKTYSKYGVDTAKAKFWRNGGNAYTGGTLGTTTNQSWGLIANGASVMDIFSGGNVGIGTSGVNRGYSLDVAGTTNLNGVATINNNSGGRIWQVFSAGTSSSAVAGVWAGGTGTNNGYAAFDLGRYSGGISGVWGLYVGASASEAVYNIPNKFALYNYGRDRMDLTVDGSNGKVLIWEATGIATPNATARLHIKNSTGYNLLRLDGTYTPTGTADANGSTGDIAWDDNYIYIKTSAGWKRTALSTF